MEIENALPTEEQEEPIRLQIIEQEGDHWIIRNDDGDVSDHCGSKPTELYFLWAILQEQRKQTKFLRQLQDGDHSGYTHDLVDSLVQSVERLEETVKGIAEHAECCAHDHAVEDLHDMLEEYVESQKKKVSK